MIDPRQGKVSRRIGKNLKNQKQYDQIFLPLFSPFTVYELPQKGRDDHKPDQHWQIPQVKIGVADIDQHLFHNPYGAPSGIAGYNDPVAPVKDLPEYISNRHRQDIFQPQFFQIPGTLLIQIQSAADHDKTGHCKTGYSMIKVGNLPHKCVYRNIPEMLRSGMKHHNAETGGDTQQFNPYNPLFFHISKPCFCPFRQETPEYSSQPHLCTGTLSPQAPTPYGA